MSELLETLLSPQRRAQCQASDMLASLHPVMQQAFVPLLAHPLEARRAQYVADLIKHDWLFEQSDDQRRWRAGRDELQRLRVEQSSIDPSAVLWNKHCHRDYFRVPA